MGDICGNFCLLFSNRSPDEMPDSRSCGKFCNDASPLYEVLGAVSRKAIAMQQNFIFQQRFLRDQSYYCNGAFSRRAQFVARLAATRKT